MPSRTLFPCPKHHMYLVHTVASKIKLKKNYIHAACSFTSSNVVFLAVRLALSVHIKVYSHFILSLWKVCRTGSCCTVVWRSELFSCSTLQKKKKDFFFFFNSSVTLHPISRIFFFFWKIILQLRESGDAVIWVLGTCCILKIMFALECLHLI